MVAPVDAALTLLEPVFAAPAIALELDDLFYEVPGPDRLALRCDRVHLRAQRREIDAIGPRRGRRENRLAAVDFANDRTRVRVEDVVVAGRRADMHIVSDDCRCSDVVAVPRPAGGGETPQQLERL
jgi:hypothetical protein